MHVPYETWLAAATHGGSAVHLTAIVMMMVGGLALFLLGMGYLSEGISAMAGARLKGLLERFASNRFSACAVGVVITALVQSSSATSVLLVGFISAGLIDLSQAVAILLGASIGSTIAAQIIAFSITEYAPIALFAGLILQNVAKRRRYRFTGEVLLGLGLVFFGMGLMSDGAKPLEDYQPIIHFLARLGQYPALGILVGIVFTALVQSSTATVGLVMAMAAGGLIDLEGAVAITLGANVGTTITGILAAIGRPTEAMQAAVSNLIFKVIATAILAFFIPQIADAARWLALADMGTSATAVTGGGGDPAMAREVANAFTLAAVLTVAGFIWFVGPIAALTRWIVPKRESEAERDARPKYIDDMYLDNPSLALDKVRQEVARQGRHALAIVKAAPDAVLSGKIDTADWLRKQIASAGQLNAAILDYTSDLTERPMPRAESDAVQHCASLSGTIQSVVEVVEQHLLPIAEQYEEKGLPVSDKMEAYITPLYERTLSSFGEMVEAIGANDPARARAVLSEKHDIKQMAREARRVLISRLGGRDEQRLQVYRREGELIEALKRIHYYARRGAKAIVATDQPEAA